jgi:broad specificity phosphatase PhoE
MQLVIVARHAESECSDQEIVNGDPSYPCPLTERGEEQARALGRSLVERELDLYVSSEFKRTRQTAEIALSGRSLPWLELPDLNDVCVGTFEAGPLELYTTWAHEHPPDEHPPGGGESRAEVAVRFARGLRTVLARSERVALVVAHGLAISFLREAAADSEFSARHAPVPYARPYDFEAAELARALDRLEAWTKEPCWSES